MCHVGSKYQAFLLVLLGMFFFGTMTRSEAKEILPIRLVALIDQDDQGESIGFPVALFYDSWASETYLISSTGRITIYDQKYFPVVSFGSGRGVRHPTGLAVDRQGRIYIAQEADGGAKNARLVVYNQAFFPLKEIVFANIPELVEFNPSKVAVSESGYIYITGCLGAAPLAGVVVLTPEGRFLKFLTTPENNAYRPANKKELPSLKSDSSVALAPTAVNVAVAEESSPIPAEFKPKSSGKRAEDIEEPKVLSPAYIDDVKIDRQGRIYLLSREIGHIYVLNAKEEYLFRFGEKGGADRKLSNAVSLGIDLERRTIFVCDYMRHSILCYDYDTGKYIFEFGGRGVGPLWFNFPNGVEVDQRGRVIVSDLFNRRLQVIDPNMDERRQLFGVFPAKQVIAPVPAAEEAVLAPSSPPALSVLNPQSDLLIPGAILPPILPAGVAGVSGYRLLPFTTPSMVMPPRMAQSRPLREFAPRMQKKLLPQLKIAAFSPVVAPRAFSKPASVRIVENSGHSRVLHGFGDEPRTVLQTFKWLPAAVGVYGPVASSLSLGSRLLSTNR